MAKPLILITNDDGCTAPGIRALIDVMLELGEVFVVAPDKPQSGMGHAITINSTLRVHEFKNITTHKEYSCSGTPADCIKIAINYLMKRRPDLIVSGINHGSNSSISVIYSGTMSAAVEGALEKRPSIGFSLSNHSIDADFEPAKKYVKEITQEILKNGMDVGTCLNVNIPHAKVDEIMGIRVCRQSKAVWLEQFEERIDPSGHPYYWLGGYLSHEDQGEETDVWALQNNYVSIVPVCTDFTAHHSISGLKKIFDAQ
jgi:5'-nucleotidase